MFMQHTQSTTSAASETKLGRHIMLKASSRAPCVDGAPPISKPCRKALSCQIVEYPSFFCVIVERWARGLSPVSVIPPMGLAPLSQYHGMVWHGIPWYGMVWLSQYQSQNLLLGLQSYLVQMFTFVSMLLNNYLLHHFRPLMMMVICGVVILAAKQSTMAAAELSADSGWAFIDTKCSSCRHFSLP